MGLGLGLGIQFNSLGGMVSKILTWGKSIPARFWGTTTPEYWGGLDAQAEVHYNRVIADGGVVPAGLGGVNSFFQVVKGVYGTSDINTAISAAYDPHYLGYKLGAGSGTTLGQAAQKLYSVKGIFGGIGTGSAYWEGVGVVGNFVSTPNAAANQITGDIEIIAKIDYKNSGNQCITSKNIGTGLGQLAWTFFINASNLLNLEIYSSAYTFATSSVSIGAAFNGFIKVTRVASTGSVQFFTSTDGITYNQLGTTQSTTIGALTNVNTPLNIGSYQSTNVFPFQGKIYRATISNTIGGTPVVDFNANQYTGANTWTSTTGEVWTVNSTGAGLADVTQTTAASQPLLLAHTGENYWWGSGQPGNFVQTPFASKLNITGDISFTAKVKLTIAPTNDNFIFASEGGSNRYFTGINAARKIFLWINGGSVTWTSVTSLSANYDGWIRASRSVSTGDCSFFTSTDGVNWTLLETVAGSTAAITTNSSPLNIGHWGTSQPGWRNYLYRATLYDNTTCTGTPVVDFNPSSYNPANSQTSWVSATSETWTINTSLGTGTGFRGLLVDRSYVMSDGIDDAMVNTFTLSTIKTIYNTYKIWDTTATGSLFASNNGAEVVDANLNGTGNCLQYDNAVNQITISLTGTGNRYTMRTAVINGANSLQQINNGTAVTGTLGTSNSTSMKIFQERNGNLKSTMVFSGMFLSLSADNSTQRTAIYNYLRSINGNSF